MKILLLSHRFYPFLGGIEVNTEIFAYELLAQGHEVRVVTHSLDSTGKEFPFQVSRNPNFHQLIKQHLWADIVFENNPCLKLSWPQLIFNKVLIVVLNTWLKRNNGSIGWQDRLKLLWLKKASRVIAVSEALRNQTFENAIVIGNPYRKNLFRVLDNVEKNESFVFLGRLVSDKGADFAIKLISVILENQNLRDEMKFDDNLNILTIIGEGPEMENLKKLTANLKIEKNVFFAGQLDGEELVQCLNRHKYLLVPSIWEEPFGNVVLEGLACGCLPIVSDGGGLPDAIGSAGLLFKRGDVNDLVSKVKELRKNSSLEKKLRENAKEQLANHFPERVAIKYLKVFHACFK
jgi:glycosyltransferase involved in cell wall biosynthesis